MLLARGFSYADAHRARIGVNYKQIPVDAPKAPVHSYFKDGTMRRPSPSPIRCMHPTRRADPRLIRCVRPSRSGTPTVRWSVPHTLCAPRTTTGARPAARPRRDGRRRAWPAGVSNVAGYLRDGVTEEVLQRTFEYWKNIDKETGDKIEAAVRNGSS